MLVDVFIQSESGATRTERLRIDGRFTIGRHPQSTLCLEGDPVSRHHAVVELGAASFRLQDTSSNGTMAGTILLRREATEVSYGTTVVVGNYKLLIFPAQEGANPQVPRAAAFAVPTSTPSQPPALAPTFTASQPQAAPQIAAPQAPPPIPVAQAHPVHAPAHQPAPQASPSHAMPAPHHAMPFGAAPSAPPAPGAGVGPATAVVHPQAQAPLASALSGVGQQPAAQPATGAHSGASRGDGAPANTESLEQEVALRREIHRALLENLDLATMDAAKIDDPSMRPRVLTALRRIVKQMAARLPPGADADVLIGELSDEALGLGPLERFLADPGVNEIMVIDPQTIYVERDGKIIRTDARFTDDERVRAVIERIVTPLGRRIDESSPLVDARLKDGSRVNAIIRPLALKGSCITIRKFSRTPLTIDKLVAFRSLTEQMARFLQRSVVARKNIIISGGTGSGKTTLLNILSSAIPSDERIVTIEDAAELQLTQPHIVSLETRPSNMEGRGEYTIRDLVRNALRMRPDRIVVGECRGGEALDMLQAMNTGHDGSLTTTHANSPREAVARIETLVLMGGVELPSRAIREQIASSIHLVVQQSRLSDGTRKVMEIAEVVGMDDEGTIELRPIFQFVRIGTGQGGAVMGDFRPTGYLPSFLDEFIVGGLVKSGEPYL